MNKLDKATDALDAVLSSIDALEREGARKGWTKERLTKHRALNREATAKAKVCRAITRRKS